MRFDDARRTAIVQDLLAPLTGRPSDLLPFEDVREALRLKSFVDRGVLEVPVGKIVGSFGRAREFNRAFLPRDESLRERWEDVRGLAEGTGGFPALELYLVGDVYFVLDGHHRVSVARTMGTPSVEARVREFLTPVPFGPEDSAEDLVLRQGEADFLEATGLPGRGTSAAPAEVPDDFRLTQADGFEKLLRHVNDHRWYLGLNWKREFGWEEAVASWRDLVYRPIVSKIRASGILDDFPGRTETDLYLFVMDHVAQLRERYGEATISPMRAVRHFALSYGESKGLAGKVQGLRRRLLRRVRTRFAVRARPRQD